MIPVLSKSHQTDHVETVVNGICGGTCTRHLGAVLHCQWQVPHRTEVPGFGCSLTNSAQIELFDNTGITHKRSTAVGSCFGTATLQHSVDLLVADDHLFVLAQSHQFDHVETVVNGIQTLHLGAVRHLHWQCSTAPRCLVQVPPQTLPKLSCAKTNSPDIGHQEPTE